MRIFMKTGNGLAYKEIYMNISFEEAFKEAFIKYFYGKIKPKDPHDICSSCCNSSCIFQSGIKREKCDFYISFANEEE